MTPYLHPPLPLIEQELFGLAETQPISGAGLVDSSWPEADRAPALPDYLAALIRSKTNATRALPATPPAVGDIRALVAVTQDDGDTRQLGRTCAVLLHRCVAGRRWAGWMVAQETDYATEHDLVLQHDDGVLAPEAAVVQLWNPVEVELRGDEALLGRLSSAALGAALKLADHRFTEAQFVATRPGRVGAWDLDADTTVVTGTPLGDDGDPRLRYQDLYRRLAAEVAAAPSTARVGKEKEGQREGRGWMQQLRHLFVRPAWTFGAMVLVMGQALWMLAGQPGTGDETVYRSSPATQQGETCRTHVRVMFRLDTSYADMVLALRRLDVRLINGPSDTGEIWVLPAPDQDAHEVANMLRQSQLVERSDVVEPDPRLCKR